MKEFKPYQLAYIGSGDKMHILTLSGLTFCGVGGEESAVITDTISFTEKYPELCQNCLRKYKSINKSEV